MNECIPTKLQGKYCSYKSIAMICVDLDFSKATSYQVVVEAWLAITGVIGVAYRIAMAQENPCKLFIKYETVL